MAHSIGFITFSFVFEQKKKENKSKEKKEKLIINNKMRGQASNFQIFSPVLFISDVIELHSQYSN